MECTCMVMSQGPAACQYIPAYLAIDKEEKLSSVW